MSPTPHAPGTESDALDHDDPLDPKRSSLGPVTRSPVQRTKRIRTQRRNTANGIQRRRNKRISW